jgi:hypothetical protein
MDSSDLSAEQWRQLAEKFGRMSADLVRLIGRMQERQFAKDDKLYAMVWDTQHSLYCLYAHANEAARALEWKDKRDRPAWIDAKQQPS